MAITFNGISRLIEITDNTVFGLDVEREIYSEWKRWSQISDNSKYAPALRTFGGDATVGGQNAPKYFFLRNFWRVFINNGNVVSIGLNLYSDDFDSPYIVAPGSGVSDRNSDAVSVNSNDIQYAAFQGGVTIDTVNGISGRFYPVGTPGTPSNNYADAYAIATARGFNKYYLRNSLTLDTGDNAEGFKFYGDGNLKSFLTINPGAQVTGIELFLLEVSGSFDGSTFIKNCKVLDISNVAGELVECALAGTVTLSGTGTTGFLDCRDDVLSIGSNPIVDFNNSGHSLAVRDYDGTLIMRNKSGAGAVEVSMGTGGTIELENTVSNGTLTFSGSMDLIDNSVSPAVINSDKVVYANLAQLAAFNGAINVNQASGTAGIKFPQGTEQFPVNNLTDALLIAESRNIKTIHFEGNLVVTDTDLSDYTLIGENSLSAVCVLSGTGNITDRTHFVDCILTGRLNGPVLAEKIGIQTLSNVGATTFPSIFSDCIFRADQGPTPAVQFANGTTGYQNIHFINCVSGVPGAGTATIDVNNSDAPFAFRGYKGGTTIANYTAGQASTIEISEGQAKFLATNTLGTVEFRGGGYISQDDSGANFIINDQANIYNYLLQLISAGGSLTPEQNQRLIDLHKSRGLDKDHEVTHTKTGFTVDDITVNFSGDRENITIVQREP